MVVVGNQRDKCGKKTPKKTKIAFKQGGFDTMLEILNECIVFFK